MNGQLLGFEVCDTNCPQNSHDFVLWVQKTLNRIMGTNIREDGILGNETKSLICKFQQSKNLSPDGKVGPKTLEAIHEADPCKPILREQSNTTNKVLDIIDEIIDKVEELFGNEIVVASGSLAQSIEHAKDVNVEKYFVRRLYNKYSQQISRYRKKMDQVIKGSKEYTELAKKIEDASKKRGWLNKVRKVGTTLGKVMPKTMALLKIFVNIFKVIEFGSVVTSVIECVSCFCKGEFREGWKNLYKSVSKIIEVGFTNFIMGVAVAGTVALCTSVGPVATAIAVLIVTIVLSICTYFFFELINQYTEEGFLTCMDGHPKWIDGLVGWWRN